MRCTPPKFQDDGRIEEFVWVQVPPSEPKAGVHSHLTCVTYYFRINMVVACFDETNFETIMVSDPLARRILSGGNIQFNVTFHYGLREMIRRLSGQTSMKNSDGDLHTLETGTQSWIYCVHPIHSMLRPEA